MSLQFSKASHQLLPDCKALNSSPCRQRSEWRLTLPSTLLTDQHTSGFASYFFTEVGIWLQSDFPSELSKTLLKIRHQSGCDSMQRPGPRESWQARCQGAIHLSVHPHWLEVQLSSYHGLDPDLVVSLRAVRWNPCEQERNTALASTKGLHLQGLFPSPEASVLCELLSPAH